MTTESAGYLPEHRAHPNFKARKHVAECLPRVNILADMTVDGGALL